MHNGGHTHVVYRCAKKMCVRGCQGRAVWPMMSDGMRFHAMDKIVLAAERGQFLSQIHREACLVEIGMLITDTPVKNICKTYAECNRCVCVHL